MLVAYVLGIFMIWLFWYELYWGYIYLSCTLDILLFVNGWKKAVFTELLILVTSFTIEFVEFKTSTGTTIESSYTLDI